LNAELPPLVTFDEALAIGFDLHDHWQHMADTAPLERDDMAWGDIVQFVLRKAAQDALIWFELADHLNAAALRALATKDERHD
jgi:hypothetical protein